MRRFCQCGPVAFASGPKAAVLAVGPLALVAGVDRYGQPFAELATGARPVPAAEAIAVAGSIATVTIGAWPCYGVFGPGSGAIGRIWLEWAAPCRWKVQP
jgi:hypothetical protein